MLTLSKLEELFQETFIQEKPDDCSNCCAIDENSTIAVNFMEKDEAMSYMRMYRLTSLLTFQQLLNSVFCKLLSDILIVTRLETLMHF